MNNLTEKLTAFASGQLDDDRAEEVEALLVRYLDEDLDPATAGEVDQLIGRHQTLADIVTEARAGKQWFEDRLAPDLKPLLSEVPASPELRQFVQRLTAEPSPEAGDTAPIPMPPISSPGSRGLYALAASILLALLVGGWSLQSTIRDRIDMAEADRIRLERELQQQKAGEEERASAILALEDQVKRYQSELAGASAGQTSVSENLADAQKQLQALRAERSNLEIRLARSLTDLATAAEQAKQNERLRTTLDTTQASMQTAAANNRRAIEMLDDKVADLSSSLGNAQANYEAADAQLAESDLIIAAMRTEAYGQAERIAELTRRVESQTAALEDKERDLVDLAGKVAELEGALTDATEQVARLEREQQTAKAATAENAGEGKASWTKQVAGYYNLYARQPRRHLVEVRANERQHIEKWLAEQLGRDVPIPDLSEAGMDFQGARLLAMNGMPVAQLTYLDADGEPLAFCFMRNRSGKDKELELSSQDELNMVDWSDQAYQYVIVGSTTFAVLEALAQGLGESYRGDI